MPHRSSLSDGARAGSPGSAAPTVAEMAVKAISLTPLIIRHRRTFYLKRNLLQDFDQNILWVLPPGPRGWKWPPLPASFFDPAHAFWPQYFRCFAATDFFPYNCVQLQTVTAKMRDLAAILIKLSNNMATHDHP